MILPDSHERSRLDPRLSPDRRRLEEAEQESPDSDQEGSPGPAWLGLLTGSLNENTRFQHVIFIKAQKGSL